MDGASARCKEDECLLDVRRLMRRHRTHEDFDLPNGIPKLLQLPG